MNILKDLIHSYMVGKATWCVTLTEGHRLMKYNKELRNISRKNVNLILEEFVRSINSVHELLQDFFMA